MKRRRMRLLTAYIVASFLPSAPAGADILIESHEGQRPPDADGVLAAFRAELETSGVKVRASDVVAVAGDQLPLSGIADPTLGREYAIALSGQVTLGTKQVFHGDYGVGLRTLEDVLAHVRENPSVVVLDTSSSAWLTKAYAALAFAQIRSQHIDAATEAVTEQIRSFPDDPIGRTVGPEVAALADQVRKALDAAPHGGLRIIVTQRDVQIYLNERPRATGRSFATAVPGTYRLLLSRGGVSRRYRVRVLPDKTTDLNIDWDADTAFRATSTWIGFAWSVDQADKTAVAVARYAHGSRQHDVLVVGIIERKGTRFLVGSIFEKQTGALVRNKAIALGRNDEACKRALAQYLLSGNTARCLIDVPANDAHLATRPAAPVENNVAHDPSLGPGLVAPIDATGAEGHSSRVVPALVLGAGVAVLATGAVLIAIDQDDDGSRPHYRDTAVLGVGVAIGGAAVSGVGGYLLYRTRHTSSVPVAAVSRDMAYVGWLGQF
jgi:hypothetical protein